MTHFARHQKSPGEIVGQNKGAPGRHLQAAGKPESVGFAGGQINVRQQIKIINYLTEIETASRIVINFGNLRLDDNAARKGILKVDLRF